MRKTRQNKRNFFKNKKGGSRRRLSRSKRTSKGRKYKSMRGGDGEYGKKQTYSSRQRRNYKPKQYRGRSSVTKSTLRNRPIKVKPSVITTGTPGHSSVINRQPIMGRSVGKFPNRPMTGTLRYASKVSLKSVPIPYR